MMSPTKGAAPPQRRRHTKGAWLGMACYQASQYALEDALDDHMGIFQRGTHSGPRLAHVAVALLRCGFPHEEPWPFGGQAVWIERRLNFRGHHAGI